jgi:serine/threonine protein kinase
MRNHSEMADIRIRPGMNIGFMTVKKLLPSWEKGGMAFVVLASPENKPEENYALKIAKRDREGTTQNYHALELEAHLLNRLDHKGIVNLAALPQSHSEIQRKKPKKYWAYANEFKERPPYYLMEYLGGGTLTDILNKPGDPSLKLSRFVSFAHKLADALSYVHQHNFVHNDLKPNNIMFQKPKDAEGLSNPILIDFGISTTTSAQYLDGLTVHYAAPEKLLHAIDPSYKPPESTGWMKVDVWGLGVILYQMLTKRYPYHGEDPDSLITTIRTRRPEPIGNFQSKVPKQLEELIMEGCLCFDVNNRSSSSEVLQKFERML